MNRRSRKALPFAALVAALALILHTIFAGAAAASTYAVDPFGNPICTADADGVTTGRAVPVEHGHLPDCCLAGCAIGGAAALPATGTFVIAPRADALATRPATARAIGGLREHSPLLPRAPPRAA